MHILQLSFKNKIRLLKITLVTQKKLTFHNMILAENITMVVTFEIITSAKLSMLRHLS